MPQIGSLKGEHGKNSCRGGNCWEKAEFSLWDVSELRKTALLPPRRRKQETCTHKSTEISPDHAELSDGSLCSVGFASLGRWELDVQWSRHWVGPPPPPPFLFNPYEFAGISFTVRTLLNLLMSAWAVAACIPTYQADSCRPISEAQVAEPTQGCWPSPGQPWLWNRGRPHVGGQGKLWSRPFMPQPEYNLG